MEIESQETTDDKLEQQFGVTNKSQAIRLLLNYLPKIAAGREDPTQADRKAIDELWVLLYQMHDIRIERTRTALNDKQSFDRYSEAI